MARHASLLVHEADDLAHGLLRGLGRVLQGRDQGRRLVIVTWHQVPHQHIVALSHLFLDSLPEPKQRERQKARKLGEFGR